jgi:hypothetical protein
MDEDTIKALGELSKPATVFIERISDAVGGIFKPYQIVRVAKAEAEADRIRANTQVEITDLQRRAFRRFLEEEAKKQINIENITRKALPELKEDAKPEQLDNDWIANFFDRCRLVSDEEMQSLWSRVLAGEANTPGKYSKRTVNFLSTLDKTEADLFTRLCGFIWVIGERIPLIYDVEDQIYNQHGIGFSALSHLESIGLVQFDPLAGYQKKRLPKRFDTYYYEQQVLIEMPEDSNNSMNIGKVMLTRTGFELVPISGSHPVDGFLEFIQNKWRSLNYQIMEAADR